ncbi:unnamed protein product [Darwinula stevensoni]|uniref:Uncharacterized protein n=1 Tax=Darwinula stevensoni TaxID=69355 RepID=A0A7R9FR76_9CRUS|nr:unnamed protein product [Darwinula stevensoni]CAG0900886.1 unnamed protein product [Darwinula stevensoni]
MHGARESATGGGFWGTFMSNLGGIVDTPSMARGSCQGKALTARRDDRDRNEENWNPHTKTIEKHFSLSFPRMLFLEHRFGLKGGQHMVLSRQRWMNHEENFLNTVNGAHTQNIERCWVEVRRFIQRNRKGTTPGLPKTHLAEFPHRCRMEGVDLFEGLLIVIKFYPA